MQTKWLKIASKKDACLQHLLMPKQEGRASPYLTSAGMCIGQLKFFKALGKSTNDQGSIMVTELGITNRF